MKLKKVLMFALVFVSLLTFVGCGSNVKLTFNVDGGSAVADVKVTLDELKNGYALPTTEKSGFYLADWCLDAEGTQPVTAAEIAALGEKQVTLYAKWLNENEYKQYTAEKFFDLADYKSYLNSNLDYIVGYIQPQLTSEQKTSVAACLSAGKAAVNATTSFADARAAKLLAYNNIVDCVPVANGVYSFIEKTNAEKTELIGLLEEYAYGTGTSGLSLFENGGYVLYNERITLGTENYISGYGFGTLAEGAITADLASESNAAWKRYYHTSNAADPGTANYLNDQGSEVGDFYSYFGASYFTVFMNEEKNGYTWTPELAKTMPEPVGVEEGATTSTTWRFQIRVGSELKYNTNSTLRAKYNDREVQPEDYLTPYKFLLTKFYGLYRGSELANTSAGPIKGGKEYYEASENGFDEEAWKNVGLSVYEEDGNWYFEVEFGRSYDEFYAMYYISSSLYMPIPQSFLDDCIWDDPKVGVDVDASGKPLTDEDGNVKSKFNADKTKVYNPNTYLGFQLDSTGNVISSPVDNSLSLGSYTLETWTPEEEVVYKKNPNYVYADTKYAIPGVHVKIFPAASTDPTATIKAFLDGQFDSCGIPQDYLDEYKNDPRARKTTGDSVFKLNVNYLDAETWVEFFGTDGKITQTAEADYWTVSPVLSNKNFATAISYSINRSEFAEARGSIASVNYFSSDYMSDPIGGMAVDATDAHARAVAQLVDGTEKGDGYDLELSRDYFRMALVELMLDGRVLPGVVGAPTEINIEIAWMYPTHESQYHNEIKNYIETAFNDDSVTGGLYHLNVNFWVGNEWSDVYYNKMMVGQFDLGFGSISGNTLDPLSFMNVLSADPAISEEFTLNWGPDTNSVDAHLLVYEGQRFSYDALYTASTGTAIVIDGNNNSVKSYITDMSGETHEDADWGDLMTFEVDAAGNYSYEFTFETLPGAEVRLDDVAMCHYFPYYGFYYLTGSQNYYDESYPAEGSGFEVSSRKDGNKTIVTISFSKEFADAYVSSCAALFEAADITPEDYAPYAGFMGCDLFYTIIIDGIEFGTGSFYTSTYGFFDVE